MSMSGLVTAGVFCALVGGGAVSAGSFMLAHQCANGEWHVTDDDSPYYDTIVCYSTWAGVLQLVGAVCLLVAARRTMAFACGPSFEKNHDGDGDIEANATPAATPVRVVN
jgi:hypothetical protein